MPLINATSFAGFLLLAYLFSFVVLAILRIATGVSIQRIGLTSLRHISYTARDGLRIDIRGLGFSIHRPTFSQPTWVSLRLQELIVTVDPALLDKHTDKRQNQQDSISQKAGSTRSGHHKYPGLAEKSELWRKLTNVKEHLKDIHHKIHWLRMLDVYATNTTLDVVGAGSVSVGSITLAVHTRRKLLDRGRLFRHKKDASRGQRPAEWIFTVRSILLGVSGREPIEILDNMSINVHGLLYREKSGLRDTSIAVKAGRLHIPIDDVLFFTSRAPRRPAAVPARPTFPRHAISLDDVVEELERPGSREAAIVQTVADSKEFFGSVLRGVQEIQLGMSFIRVSKEVESLRKANLPVVMNIVTHEIGIDLHRMTQNSPAHRMYFSAEDIAHQALVAAVSISLSLDEDDIQTNKIMYIPMATTTIRTTLPSKTMSFTEERDASERNSNVFFANLVITSPSIDLTPQHLTQLLAIAQRPAKKTSAPKHNHHRIISRLLPRAMMKFSVHEPVVRFVLPVAAPSHRWPDDFDMIIAAISSVSFDVESSHSAKEDLLYSLSSNFRVVTHTLYYQAASGIKHNLMKLDSLELQLQVSASTEVLVIASGALRSFSILMVRQEVSQSVYNIVRHFGRSTDQKVVGLPSNPHGSFLRKLPPWLLEFHFEGSNCSFETAGVDKTVSDQTRGAAIEIESWTADYVAHRSEHEHRPRPRRKISASVRSNEGPGNVTHLSPPSSPAKPHNTVQGLTDGRGLTIQITNVQGFIIESLEEWEQKPFMSVPRIEVAFSTLRDHQGPTCHMNSHVRAFYLDFSLYRAYSIGVAATVIQDAVRGPMAQRLPKPKPQQSSVSDETHLQPPDQKAAPAGELLSVDVKVRYIQLKMHMPHDPAMMFQVYEISAGRHRWSGPFLRSHLLRLHAISPHVRSAWARIVSMSAIRVDLRQTRKKTVHGVIDERSIDLSTDFIRFGVPHGLQMFRVSDNFVNTFKSLLQLNHKFRTRSDDYILKKGPEKPKHVPRVSVRSKALMFELEDDAFEWRLSNIYHIGRNEQKQRIARDSAFNLKIRKMQEARGRRASPRRRAQSSRAASRDPSPMTPRRRSRSQEVTPRRRSISRGRQPKSRLRYDRDGTCNLSSAANVQVNEAWEKLQEYNARSWKSRIDWLRHMQTSTVKNIRRMFTGADEPPPDVDDHETIMALPNRPGLLTIVISDLHLVIDKPSFPLAHLPKFLHNVGKGMPEDMQYALLVPMSLALDMGEARFMLRDYPLNLLHVPAIRPGQPPRLPSWSLRTDFVIAEEYRDDKSIRHVQVEIVPKGQKTKDGKEVFGFAIDVRRTVAPLKTYSMPVIDINTSAPTSISWGTSYQPAIQDAMMIIEAFTKPEIDPSDRVGFWDKIRLSFHSRPVINWKGDGDVQLRLKGSRDPYVVTGYGAGFVMCWRNNVRWAIHEDDDPKKFMTVRSGEYVLAIPDYNHKAHSNHEDAANHDMDSINTSSSLKNAAVFSKVIMKVSGNVQWTAGLVFERDEPGGGRSSNLKPHYKVVLRNPKYMSEGEISDYDAYRGFRSQHIHMAITLAAPFDRDWTKQQVSPSQSYNSVHLTPRFFSHFFAWWSLFSGVMSLPVRQGRLWRGLEKTSKKFGRHLATIKYGLLLSPLFIAHVYKHKDSEDYQEDVVSATGLKLRLDSFMLDLHQRREWFNTVSRTKSKQMRTSAMKINRAELDFVNADLRAVAANIQGTTADELKRATNEMLSSYQEMVPNVDMSKFTIPDHDLSWIDMDDFVEMEWILPAEANPETRILPLAFTPRFTYFRQTDHGNAIHGDESRESPFGEEDTHFCVMPSRHNDPRKIQMHLIRERLKHLEEQIKTHERFTGEHELKVVRDPVPSKTQQQERASYQAQFKQLQDKKVFLESGLRRLAQGEYPGEVSHLMGERSPKSPEDPNTQIPSPTNRSSVDTNAASLPSGDNNSHVDIDGLYSAPYEEYASEFNNRFIIHNAQVKWNNSLRNIILRYSHQVSQRRGFVYYMSRRAVKFILDIVNEQSKRKEAHRSGQTNGNIPATPTVTSPTEERDEDTTIEDRIQQLLNDANRFVTAEDTEHSPKAKRRASTVSIDPDEKLAEDFLAMNSYNIRLIAPQIQLQSEKNTTSVVLLTAKGMQLKVVSIMDKDRLSDDVSGLVQRRFALDQDGVQIFVTTLQLISKYIHLYSGNKYGNSPGSSWPPWASIETMFDFQIDPFGFQRVVQKTSASLRYEKYNALRLKYNEQVAEGPNTRPSNRPSQKESRIDHLWVDFPRLRASCDSHQYYTMYIIVLDLLMYHEPLEKTRSERLEKIMLATDFSDLRGAPEMAERLQERIRQLSELKMHFMINARYLDKRGWQDRIDLEKDLASCEAELFFVMKAINTSQQRNDERSSQSSGFLRWYLSASQVVWHLMKDKNEPLLEFQLGNATYERIDNSDGSNNNAVEIEHIRGWNLLPNALYPEIIGPYHDPQKKQSTESPKMLQMHWFMLEAIAGIPVLEEFQVTVHPLKVQLERSLGKALFEYIFPGIGSNAFDNGSFSPLMVKNMKPVDDPDSEENERARDIVSPDQILQLPDKGEMRDSSPGAIGNRLQPTYNLRRNNPGKTAAVTSNKNKGLGISSHRIGLFGHHNKDLNKSNIDVSGNALRRQSSSHSLSSFRSKMREGSTTSINQENSSKYNLTRTESQDRGGWRLRRHDSTTAEKDKKKASDDVSQMVARASNYMTLAHVKLNSFVICLSYKGQRDRNLEDLHDFVFRMPPLEYRNKTWSNLDLALHFKKDVIRALISHTGAIIGNKFSHHRPGKKQVERLREIAAGNALLPNSDTLVNTPSVSSDRSSMLTDYDSTPPRTSFQSDNASRKLEPSPLLRTGDWGEMTDSRTRGDMSFSTVSSGNATGTNNSERTSLSIESRNGGQRSPQTDSFSFSPASPSRIDPLGPISGVLPRPSTSGGGFIPGKSLLKDVVGRHFSVSSPESTHKDRDSDSRSIRPTIHKGRVRFTTRDSFGSAHGDKLERSHSVSQSDVVREERKRARSDSVLDPAQNAGGSVGGNSGTDTDGKDHESERDAGVGSVKRNAVMLLGKKVLNGFKG